LLKEEIIEPTKINEEIMMKKNLAISEKSNNQKDIDEDNKKISKLEEIEKVKPINIYSNEEEVDIKEKIRINSIEILINIVTLMPSK
jgi:hypothetical protein